jgi:hypothetical protein
MTTTIDYPEDHVPDFFRPKQKGKKLTQKEIEARLTKSFEDECNMVINGRREPLKRKLTLEQVRKLTDEQQGEIYPRGNRWQHEPTKLERLLVLCNSVAGKDHNFENLNTERKMAEKIANDTLALCVEINSIIETVTQEEAGMAMEVLHVMNIPYMRVFGDAMNRLTFQGKNLEDWVKEICYDDRLRQIREKEDYCIAVFQNQVMEPKE